MTLAQADRLGDRRAEKRALQVVQGAFHLTRTSPCAAVGTQLHESLSEPDVFSCRIWLKSDTDLTPTAC
jgi:hypothetical protein